MCEDSNLPSFLPTLGITWSFGYSAPSGGRMVLICVYLIANDIQNLFHMLSDDLNIFFKQMSIISFPLFEIVFLLLYSTRILYILTQILYQIYDVQMFLSHSRLSFHFLYVFENKSF